MGEWSELDDNLLVEIARRIRVYEDFVHFGGVCYSWRAAAIEENFRYAHAQIPWLMLPQNTSNSNYDHNMHSFLSISTGKIRQVFLPEANGKRYLSSKGWLLTIAPNLSMCLLHPFSRTQIKLPHLKKFENWADDSTRHNMLIFISKFVLSASPSSSTSDYVLMIIHGGLGRLGYYKPGDKSWTTIEEWKGRYEDVSYCDGRFYALNCNGRIVVCDFRGGGDAATTTVAAILPEHVQKLHPSYIVESSGSLLVIARKRKREWGNSRSKRIYQTVGFQVFQVELKNNTCTEVKDLDNKILFLGYNSSFSLEASDVIGSKPNCIYFTDDFFQYYWQDRKGGGKDMGVFNIKDGSIELNFWGNLCSRINPPMWV